MTSQSRAAPPATRGLRARLPSSHFAVLLGLWLIGGAAPAPVAAQDAGPVHEGEAQDPGGVTPTPRPVLRRNALVFPSHMLFIDPNPHVVTKEFTLYQNSVPAPSLGPGRRRDLFHIIYQRSGGPQARETMFGHAWSADLRRWSVDTLAFTVDRTPWNSAHVWSPSLVRFLGRDYLFYTGVDSSDDQSIGHAWTRQLDTTNTVWELERVQVLRASDTRWAVPDPPLFGGYTQFRDPFVLPDPDDPERLLMLYAAHDSVDQALGRSALAVGVARSDPGDPDRWTDLGYYRKTLSSTTGFWQLEGPHAFRTLDAPQGWVLMFSSAGTPAGEQGETTIRFERLAPGHSLADTSAAAWGDPEALMPYLKGDEAVFGWSGSEHLRFFGRHDVLAGFTAWGPVFQGIALARVNWQQQDFNLSLPTILAVDEHRSPTRAVELRIRGANPGRRSVEFEVDVPLALEAHLEVFDVSGRRVVSLLQRPLVVGVNRVSWPLAGSDGRRVPDGVYWARLAYAGGARTVSFVVAR